MTVVYEDFDPVFGSQYMQPFLWLVIIALIFAAGVGFAMGANDVSNSFGTSVGARVLSIPQACFLAGLLTFIGALFLGASVSETIKRGIVNIELFDGEPHIYMAALTAAYIGAFSLVMSSTLIGMPVSTTHAIVGGVLGASLAAFGNQGVDWFEIGMIAVGWVTSPLFAGLITAAFYLSQCRIILREENIEKAKVKQLWFASFQIGLVFWLLTFFVLTKVVDDRLPENLQISKLGKDSGPPKWPGSLLLPLTCFGVMFGVALLSRYLIIPIMFRLVEMDHNNETDPEKGESKTKEKVAAELEATEQSALKFKKRCWKVFSDNLSLNHDDKPFALAKHATKSAEQMHEFADSYPRDIEIRFKAIQVISACFMALSHGANDISNVVGPVAGVIDAFKEGSILQSAPTSYGILAYGGVFIVLGLATYGTKVMATIGHNTTKITPSRGVNIEIGAAFAVTIASYLGIPVSTTQCVVGSIVAVGLCNKEGLKSVNLKLFAKIFMSWILTPLISGLVAAAFFKLFEKVVVNQVPGNFFPLTNASEVYGVNYGFSDSL